MESLLSRDTHTLSVYVSNKPGVLARIAQVFARRGYNIDSLVVSSSVDGEFSRMTITAKGNPGGLDQIIKQVNKLIDVFALRGPYRRKRRGAGACPDQGRRRSGRSQRSPSGAEHFKCKTVDLTESSMILMATGGTDKIDALVRMVHKYNIIELVRTGQGRHGQRQPGDLTGGLILSSSHGLTPTAKCCHRLSRL